MNASSRIVVVALGLLSLVPAASWAWTQSDFVIGTYWDPPVTNHPAAPDYADSAAIQTDLARFHLARAAYINLVTGKSNYPTLDGLRCHLGTTTALADYLLYLGSRTGMRVLVSDRDFHRAARFDTASARAVVRHYRNLDPGRRSVFYGYNVRDEPGPRTRSIDARCPDPFDSWADENLAWAATFKREDPSRLAYINLLQPTGRKGACYEAYLEDYLNPPDPHLALDVVSYDHYPFRTDMPGQLDTTYFYGLATIRARAGHRPVWAYPRVLGNAPWTDPGDEHFRFMAFCPVAYGAKGLVYFTYVLPHCPGNPEGCGTWCHATPLVTHAGVPTPKYVQVQTINHFLTKLAGPMVMSSTWLGTFHKSAAPSVETMHPDWLIDAARTPIVRDLSDPASMVGIFRSNVSSTSYLLVVNKDLGPRTTTVTLKGNHTGKVFLAPTVVGYAGDTIYVEARTSYHATSDATTFILALAGGEGRLVRLDRQVATLLRGAGEPTAR